MLFKFAKVLLEADGNADKQLVAYIGDIPEIKSIWSVSGKYDLVLSVETTNSESIESVLSKLRHHTKITKTDTLILLFQKI